MAFNQQSWGRISGSGNNDVITLQDGNFSGAPNVFTYISATDTKAQIAASNYFLPVSIELNVNDLIYISGTDGVYFLTVATVSNVAVTTTINAVGGNVIGPGSSVAGDIAVFDDTTGEVLADSGVNIDDVATYSGATVIGELAQFSSVAGEIETSGVAAADVVTATGGLNVIAGVTGVYAGGGTSNAFTVTGLTTDYEVVATMKTATNAVAVSTAVATDADELTITFTADPGAGTTVTYWAFLPPAP